MNVYQFLISKNSPLMILELFYFLKQSNFKLLNFEFLKIIQYMIKITNMRQETITLFFDYYDDPSSFPKKELIFNFFEHFARDGDEKMFELYYNQMRTFIELKNYVYNNEISNELNIASEDEFMKHKEVLIMNFYSKIFEITIKYNFKTLSEMLYIEMNFKNYFSTETDILSLLYMGLENQQRFNEIIYQTIPSFMYLSNENDNNTLESTPTKSKSININKKKMYFSDNFHKTILKIVLNLPANQQGKILTLNSMFLRVSPYSKKQEVIKLMILEYEKRQNFVSFENYLSSFVAKKKTGLDDINLRLCVKLINDCGDQRIKNSLKSQINVIKEHKIYEIFETKEDDRNISFDPNFWQKNQEKYYQVKKLITLPYHFKEKKGVRKRILSKKKYLSHKFMRITFGNNPYDEEFPYVT